VAEMQPRPCLLPGCVRVDLQCHAGGLDSLFSLACAVGCCRFYGGRSALDCPQGATVGVDLVVFGLCVVVDALSSGRGDSAVFQAGGRGAGTDGAVAGHVWAVAAVDAVSCCAQGQSDGVSLFQWLRGAVLSDHGWPVLHGYVCAGRRGGFLSRT